MGSPRSPGRATRSVPRRLVDYGCPLRCSSQGVDPRLPRAASAERSRPCPLSRWTRHALPLRIRRDRAAQASARTDGRRGVQRGSCNASAAAGARAPVARRRRPNAALMRAGARPVRRQRPLERRSAAPVRDRIGAAVCRHLAGVYGLWSARRSQLSEPGSGAVAPIWIGAVALAFGKVGSRDDRLGPPCAMEISAAVLHETCRRPAKGSRLPPAVGAPRPGALSYTRRRFTFGKGNEAS